METLVPPLLEEENCVDVMHLIPQERENRTHEPLVGVPVCQITEDGVEVTGMCLRGACLESPSRSGALSEAKS